MTIRTRLAALLLVPLCAILYLGTQGLLRSQAHVSELRQIEEMVELAVVASALVHETQKERGMSAGHLASKGAKFEDALGKQRKVADERRAAFEVLLESFDSALHGKDLESTLVRAMDGFSRLDGMRAKVSALEVAVPDAVAYYTDLNTALLGTVDVMAAASSNSELTTRISAYASFLKAKEQAGLERATVSSAFATDAFAPGQYSRFIGMVTSQRVHTAGFLAAASPEARSFFHKAVQGSHVNEVDRMRGFVRQSQKRSKTIAAAGQFAGYGGLIHQFKNYVLRRNPKYATRIEDQYRQLTERLAEYASAVPPESPHAAAVVTYRETLDEYRDNAKAVAQMIAAGHSTEQIDAAVKISDGPAVAALNMMMTTGGFGVDPAACFAEYTGKINSMKQVEDYLSGELAARANELAASAALARLVLGAVTVLTISLTAIGGFLIIRSILSALGAMREGMREIEAGDLTYRLGVDSEDELGQLARSVNSLVERLCGTLESVVAQSSYLERASDELLNAASQMSREAGGMSERSNSVAASSVQLTSNLDRVAQMVQETTSNIGSVSTAVEEMSTNLSEVTERVSGVSQDVITASAAVEELSTSAVGVSGMATEAVTTTEQAVASAKAADEMMQALSVAAAEASGMVQTIDDIAGQINLLALNATIEAASAGESGRGFAVVANEVKELAGQTASATDEIRDRIGEMQQNTESALGAMRANLEIIANTGDTSRQIDNSVGEQRQAASEIAETIVRTAEAAKSIAGTVEECAGGANETARRSAEIAGGATETARNVIEASRGADEIASAIRDVNLGLEHVNGGADTVSKASEALREISAKLSRTIEAFQVSSDG